MRDPHFITSLYELDSPVQVKMEDKGRFLAVICVEGFGYVDSQAISAGEAVLVLDQTAPISLKPSSKSSCKPSCLSESSLPNHLGSLNLPAVSIPFRLCKIPDNLSIIMSKNYKTSKVRKGKLHRTRDVKNKKKLFKRLERYR